MKKAITVIMCTVIIIFSLSISIFGATVEEALGIPDNAIQISKLLTVRYFYKIPGITDWIIKGNTDPIESDSVYFRCYYRDYDDTNKALVENNYTYYFDVNIKMGTNNNNYNVYDALNFYLSNSNEPNTGSHISIRGFSDFTIIFEPGYPLTHIQLIFRTDSSTDYSIFTRFVMEYYGSGATEYNLSYPLIYRWYDIDSTIYQTIVNNKLNEISASVDEFANQNHEDLDDIEDQIITQTTTITNGISQQTTTFTSNINNQTSSLNSNNTYNTNRMIDNQNQNANMINDTLTGDPDDYTSQEIDDNFGTLRDINSAEDDVKEIFNDIELSDGTSVQIDSNFIDGLQDFIVGIQVKYQFNRTMALYFRDLFNVFYPYLGGLIFTILLLGAWRVMYVNRGDTG